MRWLVERRLTDVQRRLRRAREELGELDAQARFLADEADDARIRSLVSETPLAERDHRESQRHADAMEGARRSLVHKVAELEAERDRLLERLSVRP